MIVCIIPARGGSKRIKKKNIKLFNQKPIISYSIKKAFQSNCFDRIICSTDSKAIASIAKEYRAETPFLRPLKISDDKTPITSVVAHAIDYLKKKGDKIDIVCCIFPTAPLMKVKDIQQSFKTIKKNKIDYCFSATKYSFPIQRSIKIRKDKKCEMFYPEMFYKRSQDLQEAYHDAGQFYWGKADTWLNHKLIFSTKSFPYVIPNFRVQDIDTHEDWKNLELKYKILKKNGELD